MDSTLLTTHVALECGDVMNRQSPFLWTLKKWREHMSSLFDQNGRKQRSDQSLKKIAYIVYDLTFQIFKILLLE